MKINKKIICLFIFLTIMLVVNSVSAADNTSDIIASDDNAMGVIGDAGLDENLGATATYVITNSTFNNYFTNGELNDNVSAGSTLDFQGTFTGNDYKVNITKPVNIISSTEDALFNEIGKKDSTGGCFHISAGGSGTNVTGLNFLNSAFYVTNASDVSIENIQMIADMSGVGSGTGFMCVQAGSNLVSIRDSYFENRGTGSSIVVFGSADYCTFENNEVFVNGSSGNAVYITSFVPAKNAHDPVGNTILNNYVHGKGSALAMGIVVAGFNNTIEKNTVDYTGSGIAVQSFSSPANNTYIDNILTGGCSFTAAADSFVSGNSVEGTMSAQANSVLEKNNVKTLSLSAPNVVVNSNVINDGGVTLEKNALNTTLTNNIIYAPVTVKSKNNTIQKNTIETDDEYAIDLTTSTGNEVSFNSLIANNLTGDAAVKAGENNTVHDNGNISNIVTEDNFFYFFDENGNYKNLNFTELFFKGEFDNLVNAITINTTLSITGLDAHITNMAFILLGDNITLNNMEFLFKEFDDLSIISNHSAILIDAVNTTISDLIINYISDHNDAYIINAKNADNLNIHDNNLLFESNTNGTFINNAVYVLDSSNVLFENNSILGLIPSCYVDWREIPPGQGIWVKFPVSEGLVFDGCSNLSVVNNGIEINYKHVVGDYDTIYAIDIKNAENVKFLNNTVGGVGHTYIYGLYVEANNLTVDNNIFNIVADEHYANAIEIEASKDAVISNNKIDVLAKNIAYPIYSGMNGGDLEANYLNNEINANADIVYGMELSGSHETVSNNIITVNGNQTTGLAVKSKTADIINNTIYALGVNLNNKTTVETFAPMTAGIQLAEGNYIVYSNTINSNSKGISAKDTTVAISSNEINVEDNGNDDAYAIIAENSFIGIGGNTIAYVGRTNGSTINNAINLKECNDALIIDNTFEITIPSAQIDWREVPPASGNWVKFPVSEGIVLDECSNLTFNNNTINVGYNEVIGDFDTIYAVDIKNGENVELINNTIDANGLSYIYGLYVEANNLTVDSNIFNIESENYANAIEIEASKDAVISNNKMNVTSKNIAYPIYSGMNGGDLEANYLNNEINATADIVYGMELSGSDETVVNNIITVNGNQTTGLAVKSKTGLILNNTINALGTNLNNKTTVDTFEPMTAGIQIIGSDTIVDSNKINSNSRGIYAKDIKADITENEINVEDNGKADSYAIIIEDSDIGLVANNITYVGKTNGSTVNNAIYIKDCNESLVYENTIDITLPSCYVDWKEDPAGSGNWVSDVKSEGIHVESPLLYFENNNVTLNYDGVVGAFDSIYAVHINSDNSKISGNNIKANGHSYIYGLEISGENFTVENNSIVSTSDNNYANTIDIEGPASGVIQNNELESIAPEVTYTIYSAMSNGNVSVDYLNNTINSNANLAYGMELRGVKENVENNILTVAGDKSIAILSTSQNLTVKNNIIDVIANETFPESTAFLGKYGNATITDNEIRVDGDYTINVADIAALVKDNNLIANELTGDASVNYNPETSEVYNNTPVMEEYFLTSEGLIKYYGNAKALEFQLLNALYEPVSNKTITIIINGVAYKRTTDENGTAKININLVSGNYTVNATYSDDKFNLSCEANVTILSTIESSDLTKMFRNATKFEATFVDSDGNPLKNTDIIFNIHGIFYTRTTDEKGVAGLNINLDPGVYVITSLNPKTGESIGNNITVLSTIVENKDLTKYYKNDSQYVVKILDEQGNAVGAGKVVTFNINGVFYTRTTNESGHVKLNINLNPGEYIITTEYNGLKVANKIKVLSILETKDLVMKYKDGSTFDAKLLDGQGNPYKGQSIQFNVNGVLYYRTTDSSGVAKLNINLQPGEYIITSSFNGLYVGNSIKISS